MLEVAPQPRRHSLAPLFQRYNAALAELCRDVRHAIRTLARQRTFTLTALAALALGIGANTAIFSIVYGMLLRPLPYPDPEALVRVGQLRGRSRSTVALDNRTLPLIQERARSFEAFAAYGSASFEWASPDGTVTLSGARVSPSLFPLLRATPHLGRFFAEEEARVGADRVAVLSHGAWTRRFGSDPDIVGSVLDVDDAPLTVIGVAAERFYFPSSDAEIWTPYVIPAFTSPDPGDERRMVVMIAITVLGRLRPGVSPEQAATEVRTLLQGSENEFSTALRAATRAGPSGDTPEVDARVVPLREEMVGEYRPALLALTGAMGLVLLIACINVAGLLLARGVSRQRTLAVCAALGAGRSRIVRQLLTESVVLGLIGGALGLAAAAVVLRVVPALVPGNVARLDEVGLDGVVLAFTLGLSVMVGLAFGAVPAVQWSRLPLVRVLNEGSAQSTAGFRLLRSSRTRAALATAQVALALVLLVGAGLLLRSFVGLLTVDRGYDLANVITAHSRNPDLSFRPDSITPEVLAGLRTASQRHQVALLEAMDRIERLPDVAAVGVSSGLPLAVGGGTVMPVRVVGRPAPTDANESPRATLRVASPGYFEVLRMRLRAGRFFFSIACAGAASPTGLAAEPPTTGSSPSVVGFQPAVPDGVLPVFAACPLGTKAVVLDMSEPAIRRTTRVLLAPPFLPANPPGSAVVGGKRQRLLFAWRSTHAVQVEQSLHVQGLRSEGARRIGPRHTLARRPDLDGVLPPCRRGELGATGGVTRPGLAIPGRFLLDLRGQQRAVLRHPGPLDLGVEHGYQAGRLEQKEEDHQTPAHAIPRIIAATSIAHERARDARSNGL